MRYKTVTDDDRKQSGETGPLPASATFLPTARITAMLGLD